MSRTVYLFLTPNELAELCGYVTGSAQGRWLDRNGWAFARGADGRPKVLRDYFQARMMGTLPSKPPATKAGPVWSKSA